MTGPSVCSSFPRSRRRRSGESSRWSPTIRNLAVCRDLVTLPIHPRAAVTAEVAPPTMDPPGRWLEPADEAGATVQRGGRDQPWCRRPPGGREGHPGGPPRADLDRRRRAPLTIEPAVAPDRRPSFPTAAAPTHSPCLGGSPPQAGTPRAG